MNIKRIELLLKEKDLESVFKDVIKDTAELEETHHVEQEDIDGYLFIYNLAMESGKVQYDDDNLAYILMMTVNVLRYAKFYWRGRKYADALYDLLNKKLSLSKKQKADFYLELGTYYRSISRYQKALDSFNKSYELKKNEEALYYIVLTEQFINPSKEIVIKDNAYISPRIKLALQGKSGLKIDPIELSDDFINCFDEVHEEMLIQLEKEGDLHLCHQVWGILTDLYAKRGIFWRSPALMNPRVMFD